MSAYWSTSSSTSSSTSTWGGRYEYYYGNNYRPVYYEKRRSPRLFGERPLKTLVEAERALKEQAEVPPSMPQDTLMFDPEELVLGGETGWKKL